MKMSHVQTQYWKWVMFTESDVAIPKMTVIPSEVKNIALSAPSNPISESYQYRKKNIQNQKLIMFSKLQKHADIF